MGEVATEQSEVDPRMIWRELHGRNDLFGENGFVARDLTHDERNRLNGERSPTLIETAAARDAVLFYARQDAAHAVLNTGSLLREVAVLRRQIRTLTALVGILLVAALGVVGLAAWALGLVR